MKRTSKIILFICLSAAILCAAAVVSINIHVEQAAASYMRLPDGNVDAIIVPGCMVHGDTVSLSLKARLDKGLELYRNGVSDRIIVSGDHGREDYDEVNVMRDYLIRRGVPRSHIFMDHAGFDTYATVYRAHDIFCVSRAVIVSQHYHNVRAVYTADALDRGIKLYSADADDPYVNKLRFIREPLARVKAFIEAELIKPEPKYLGREIPVWGNGEKTENGKS